MVSDGAVGEVVEPSASTYSGELRGQPMSPSIHNMERPWPRAASLPVPGGEESPGQEPGRGGHI